MKRARLRFCLSTLLVALLTSAWLHIVPDLAKAAGGPGEGQFQIFPNPPSASDFRMGSLDGGVFRLSDLKGSVVLLNFWRKDCRFCAQEKRHLKSMVKQVNRPDLKVLCVNFWDSPAWVRLQGEPGSGLVYATKPDESQSVLENTVRGRLMGYFVLNDAREAVYEIKGFPSTYVIDKAGRVVASHLGLVDWSTPSVKQWIAGLVGPGEQRRPAGPQEYQLPGWLDGILSRPVDKDYGAVRRAQAAPLR